MNKDNILWTAHARQKMKFYGLSESRLRRVLKFPQRIEEGIAPETTAVMSPTDSKKRPTEIWLMYQLRRSKGSELRPQASEKIKIISVWRYPGVSPKGKAIPIPADIRKELQKP